MRKAILDALGILVTISMCASTTFGPGTGSGRDFVNTDTNGICDNADIVCNYTDGNGICNVCGNAHESCLTVDGKYFVDADGDGICDNCGINHCSGMAGTNCDRNYVDNDGDNVCDNYSDSNSYGNGYGRNSQGSHHKSGSHGGCRR